MLDPIVKSIEVPCNQAKAFRIFVNEMSSWWPLDRFTVSAMGGTPAKAIRVDARAGGEIVEIAADGTEHRWGTITSYEPDGFIGMDFHIPAPGETAKEKTRVEVRFTALGDNQTRVELVQSDWEALGPRAGDIRGGYGKGWTMIFERAYKAACAG